MKKIVGVVLLVIGLGVMWYVFFGNGPTATSSVPPATPTPAARVFTLADVIMHNQPGDCWLAIDGGVYDVSKYIKGGMHPGKEAILKGCGADASKMFGKHSERARGMLKTYFIGTTVTR